MLAKLASWFLSEKGRRFVYYAAGTAISGVLVAHYLPHTLLLNQYRDIVRLYKNGVSVSLSKELQDRFQKALDLVQVEENDRDLYQPFHSYGFDIMSAGSSYSKFGVIIGLPVNYSYDNIDVVDRPKIKVNEESINWDSDEGQKLLNSLVLSENAQLYSMAREIKYRQTPKPMLDAFFATSASMLTYCISCHINTKFNFYIKPVSTRLLICDTIIVRKKIDKELLHTDRIFSEGGLEYYSKLIERNQALRKLLGPDGEKRYSVLGNDNSFIRCKHIPIVQRKSFFESSFIH